MSKRCKIILYSIVASILILIIMVLIKFLFFSGLFTPKISLIGEHTMQVEVNKPFVDPGVKARFRFQNYDKQVTSKSNVNVKKLGDYTVTYRLTGHDTTKTRKVSVVDTTPPKLTLKGANKLRVFVNGTFEDPGYQAIDNADQDITKKVIVKSNVDMAHTGNYKITYTVRDHSGNQQKKTRKVEVHPDPTKTKVYYNFDDYDNSAEEWWFRKSKNHERTTAAREESFLAKYDSFFQGPDEKVIYLTFDEGGNDITYIKEITEILNKHDVKATYFLTRNYIKNEAPFMNELVKEGHLISNHTWHHYDMPLLATQKDIDTFVSEVTETEKTYMEVTGKQMLKCFRFPKGGMSERSLRIIQELGYKTFFWSHAYYDFNGDVSKEEAYQTLVDHYHNGAIYLLHPSNKGNYEAMDDFIKTMKEKGYRFDTVENIGE